MTTQQTIKPILKYPGAKWNCASWIISHFPAHAHYVEPYFGSGAVFFNKQPAKHEVINDLSGDVVNLFRVIRDSAPDLAALIEMTPWARSEFECTMGVRGVTVTTGDALEDARRFLVRVWMGHGARLNMRTGWTHGGNSDTSPIPLWRVLPDKVIATARRLQDAEIDNRPALDVITRCFDSETLLYVDPPYLLDTRCDKGVYQHEMTDADHAVLLDALDAHPGPVVLSGYHCALYDDRLAHWHTREKQTQAEKGNTRTEGAVAEPSMR
jgi:DNA adenine methylase